MSNYCIDFGPVKKEADHMSVPTSESATSVFKADNRTPENYLAVGSFLREGGDL